MDEMSAVRGFGAAFGVPDDAARTRVRARTEQLVNVRPRRRARFRSGRVLIALAVLALLAFAALAGAASGLLQLFGVQEQPGTAVPSLSGSPARYVLGDRLFGFADGPQNLGEPATGESAWADAVPSPDATKLLYEAANAQGQAGRALRIHDVVSGNDEELVADAFAPVWRADGVIAYGKTAHRNSSGGDVGAVIPARVVVRSGLRSAPTDWISTPGDYVPLAWARRRLLVERLGANGTATLLAVDGPGLVRRLADGWLDALSQDGRLAAISDDGAGGRPTGPLIRLVDTANGAVAAELDVRRSSVDGLSWGALAAAGPGDWSGSTIVVPAGGGVLVLSTRKGALAIEKVARFTADAGVRGAEYLEAHFVGPGSRTILVKAAVLSPRATSGQARQSVLACDIDKSACLRGGPAGSPAHWLGLVANPSRPLRFHRSIFP